MALSHVGVAEQSALDSGSMTVTHPVTIAADDVVFLAYAAGDDSSALSLTMTTSGYTALTDVLWANDTDDAMLRVFRKVMPSTPDSTAVTAAAGGGTDCSVAAVEHVWRGVDTTTPEDATTTTATGIDSSVPDSPPITTVSADTTVLAIGSGSVSDTAVTAPTNYVNQVDRNSADTEPITVGIGSRSGIGAETTQNPGAWTNFTTTTGMGWCAATVCIRPASIVLTAASTSFSLSGTAATLRRDHRLNAEAGSFNLTGQTAALSKGVTLSAASGSFALSGTTATLRHDHRLDAAGGSFALTGATASLLRNRLLAAAAGSFSLTGQDATLTYTPASGETLAAEAGSFGLSGTAATFRIGYVLAAGSGAFSLAGTAATMRWDRRLAAAGGTYALTGNSANLGGVAPEPIHSAQGLMAGIGRFMS